MFFLSFFYTRVRVVGFAVVDLRSGCNNADGHRAAIDGQSAIIELDNIVGSDINVVSRGDLDIACVDLELVGACVYGSIFEFYALPVFCLRLRPDLDGRIYCVVCNQTAIRYVWISRNGIRQLWFLFFFFHARVRFVGFAVVDFVGVVVRGDDHQARIDGQSAGGEGEIKIICYIDIVEEHLYFNVLRTDRVFITDVGRFCINRPRCEREYRSITHVKGHRGYAIIVVHNLTHNFVVHIHERCGCKAFDAMRLAVVGDSFLAAIGYKLNRIPQFLGTIRYRKLAILYFKRHLAEVFVQAYKRVARQSHCVFADICA